MVEIDFSSEKELRHAQEIVLAVYEASRDTRDIEEVELIDSGSIVNSIKFTGKGKRRAFKRDDVKSLYLELEGSQFIVYDYIWSRTRPLEKKGGAIFQIYSCPDKKLVTGIVNYFKYHFRELNSKRLWD